ncbi:MAG: hypothetical protein ACON39_07120 [Coraliomargaritaceae bacterium]
MRLRKLGLVLLLSLLLIGVIWFLRTPSNEDVEPVLAPEPIVSTVKETYTGPSGNEFLEEHGLAGSTAVKDLQLVGRVMDGLSIFFRQFDTRYVATNEQLSDFLTGSNPQGLQYLDPDLPIFKNGVLTDRWGHPYIVHPLAAGTLEIRSIGPDGIPYTEDDLWVNPDDGVQGGQGNR